MSDRIPVRTVGGDVIAVPAMRLRWSESHPRLLELLDWYKECLLAGGWAELTHADELAKLEELLAEVAKVSTVTLADESDGRPDCDLVDVRKIYHALRGVGESPDPTGRQPG